ncbi:homoserine kinase [Solicola sp. PLA-1-18]|uniref:homoserine kinase n=1 Tax=Solicola sp. PLA-1-18 TaxID=3380532 RepID=UPI003B825462
MSGTFVTGPVRVRVPASSANLGPGFDSLGLALDLHDDLEGEVLDGGGLEVHVDGAGAGAVPLDETHLVVTAMRATFDALGVSPPGLRLRCRNEVPHARGLGSSSAAIVGGVVLAAALVTEGDRLDADARLRIADRLEGHPDNVAAALHGGLTLAWTDEHGPHVHAVPVDVPLVVAVPPTPVETSVARGLLPASVPHADAARNAGRTALVVPALTGHPELLLAATDDRLHQHYRAAAMPESYALVGHLRRQGIPAVISGAGPTVLAFAPHAGQADAVLAAAPHGWLARPLDVAARGAHVVRT